MSLHRTIRFMGLATMVGGLFWMGAAIAALITGEVGRIPNTIGFFACIFLALGIFGIHAVQADRGGILSAVGGILTAFAMILIGAFTLAMLTGSIVDEQAMMENSQFLYMLAILSWLFGVLALSVSTIRSGVFPRWPGILLIIWLVGALADSFIPGVPFFVGRLVNILYGISFLTLGWIVWVQGIQEVEPQADVVAA